MSGQTDITYDIVTSDLIMGPCSACTPARPASTHTHWKLVAGTANLGTVKRGPSGWASLPPPPSHPPSSLPFTPKAPKRPSSLSQTENGQSGVIQHRSEPLCDLRRKEESPEWMKEMKIKCLSVEDSIKRSSRAINQTWKIVPSCSPTS